MAPENKIIIVAASDNHYAILLAVLIKSIEENHETSEKIDFYILDDGISFKNRLRISSSADPSKITLNWIEAKDIIPASIQIPTDKSTYPPTAYLRLFAASIIPSTVKRFIYLDVDMIVLEDISKLWHINIEDKIAAAVVDSAKTVSCKGGGISNYAKLGLPPETKYFNTGIMIVDPIKWRESDIANKVINCLNHNIDDITYADQYGLNVVLADQWFELDPCWNVFSNLTEPHPFVIHFIHIKPIFKSYYGNLKYRDEFYKYLNLTSWRGFKPFSNYKRLLTKGLIRLKKHFMRS